MHKGFYASGFLFHLKTQQILLHQSNLQKTSPSLWTLLSGEGKEDDSAKAFQRIIFDIARVKIDLKRIFPVYDYFHKIYKAPHFVFFAETKVLSLKNASPKETLSWFTFKQVSKLSLSEQTKQDIVVAERVIKAQLREQEAKHSQVSSQ